MVPVVPSEPEKLGTRASLPLEMIQEGVSLDQSWNDDSSGGGGLRLRSEWDGIPQQGQRAATRGQFVCFDQLGMCFIILSWKERRCAFEMGISS